ncbi:hypothetical protein SNE40_013888 [Patella caerulea]|uniref:GYF domain-containing protein n=1 Tax=Patella caerulea TaxID=87958 RepID=A0AAN8PPL0_PATCE
MADTLNFGPEWLRALSDGNSVASPPPTPGLGGKFKLASNRYGREEMLALFHEHYKAPDELKEIPSIYIEPVQKPLAFISLSEEEQRLMSQSVNSVTVLRSMGRGSGPPIRGGRGAGSADRGRGRGRGRGDSYIHRVLSENGENNSGGFGIPGRGPNNEGWEEVGKKYDRNYPTRTPFDENTGVRREYNRSLSNDNWREKTSEDDDGNWRRAGTRDKWNKTEQNTRGSWRDPNHDPRGFDSEKKSNGFSRDGPPSRTYQRSRSSESWDTEDNLPEWSTDVDDPEAVGSFDASGAFVAIKEPGDPDIDENSPPNTNKQNSKLPVSKEKDIQNNNNNKEKEELRQKSNDSAINKKMNNEKKINSNTSDIKANPESPRKQGNNKSDTVSKTSVVQSPAIKKTPHELAIEIVNNNKLDNRDTPRSIIPTAKSKEGEALEQMKLQAESLVAIVTEEDDKEPELSPSQPDNPVKWLYKDPQGDVQGPFSSDEMTEWFSAGYFTMSLLVKRGCDERFQQLGELIKRWGRVPFLAGVSMPPLLNSPVTTMPSENTCIPPISQPLPGTPPTEQVNVLQQQFLLQQQLLQQQLLMRQLQQQQQQQMVLQHMQDQEGFKGLPLAQQQQLVMQMMMSQPMLLQQQLQQQQQQQHAAQQTHRLSPLHTEQPGMVNHPAFHRSMSQPSSKTESPNDETIWGGVNTATSPPLGAGAFSQPTSVWDLEAGKQSDPADLHAQIQRMQQEMDRVRKMEEDRKREEERKQLELQRKQEEIQKQQELLMREKQEIERQKQIELQKYEELKHQEQLRLQQQDEERKRAEEIMRQEAERQYQKQRKEEDRRRQEERRIEEERKMEEERQMEEQRRMEEERRREERQKEEERRREEKRQKEEARRKAEEEKRQQELLLQEEMLQQEELQRQRDLEEQLKKQEEAERQAELQRQQQEALRKLQQQQREQLSNIKLPATAQWAKQQNQVTTPTSSLTEIQQQEQKKWQIEEQQRLVDQQKLQMEMLHQQKIIQQQQQSQQQKTTWASHVQSPATGRKSLMQIQQEEQAKLAENERKKLQSQQKQQQIQQQQQQQAKNLSLASAAAWAGQSSNNSASVWSSDSGASGGIWEQPAPSKKKAATSSEFPALKNKKPAPAPKSTKTSNGKTTRDEDVVKSLFKPQQKQDEFTTWCENTLRNITTSVDVPTFIAFLQDVESPYEVHDYVRSYLGESKVVTEFSKQYLEKRSQYKNKKRQEKKQQEDSIWGPALTPKERKPVRAAEPDTQKSKGKKKKKMQKLDGSVLGFTCHAAPDRVNAGEIENLQ